jgi:hypothetical protein
VTAPLQEQGVDTCGKSKSGLYRFFVIVDQEALESVLNSDSDAMMQTGFARLVYGDWEPEVNEDGNDLVGLDEELEPEPLEGCTQEDVGWMKVPYAELQGIGATAMCNMHDWDMY